MTLAYLTAIAGGWRHCTDVLTVSYTRQPSGTVVPDVKATRDTLSVRDLQLMGMAGIDSQAAAWTIWAETLGSFEPVPGDTLTYDGATWTIQNAERIGVADVTMKWRCMATKQRTI